VLFTQEINEMTASVIDFVFVIAEAVLAIALACGLVIYFDWTIALVSMGLSPILFLGLWARARFQKSS